MRRFWLALTDARLKVVLKTLRASGPGLGELVKNPGAAPAFFRPLRAGIRRTYSAAPSAFPASSQALVAAEDFTARLEKFFSDLALHKTPPDAAAREALLYLQQACAEAPGLLSLSGRAGASAEIRGLCAGARKSLALARAACLPAGRQSSGSFTCSFTQNLKFGSIYSGLDAVFDAYERCAEALYRIPS